MARFEGVYEQDSRRLTSVDPRFNALDLNSDLRRDALERKIDALDARIERRLDAIEAKIDRHFTYTGVWMLIITGWATVGLAIASIFLHR